MSWSGAAETGRIERVPPHWKILRYSSSKKTVAGVLEAGGLVLRCSGGRRVVDGRGSR